MDRGRKAEEARRSGARRPVDGKSGKRRKINCRIKRRWGSWKCNGFPCLAIGSGNGRWGWGCLCRWNRQRGASVRDRSSARRSEGEAKFLEATICCKHVCQPRSLLVIACWGRTANQKQPGFHGRVVGFGSWTTSMSWGGSLRIRTHCVMQAGRDLGCPVCCWESRVSPWKPHTEDQHAA
jgi:hypothetical protein